MFKINPNPTFKKTVEIPLKSGTASLTVVFKHLNRAKAAHWARNHFDAIKPLFQNMESASEEDKMNALIDLQTKTLMQVMEGWEGVDAQFGFDSLQTLLGEYQAAFDAIFLAFNQTTDAAEKN